ncbi:MAG: c-type cytochrome [Planctomycetota bacterium]|nr:c-type cytochrome [Planctomycetota bacterium]
MAAIALSLPLAAAQAGDGDSAVQSAQDTKGEQPPADSAKSAAAVLELLPVKLDQAALDALGPSLIVTYRSAAKPERIEMTLVPAAALYVGEGRPPSSFLPGGPFTATLEGYLKAAGGALRTISMEGHGHCVVKLNDQPVLDGEGDLSAVAAAAVSLSDYTALTIEYKSPSSGAAWLRLFWQSAGQPREPLPTSALLSDRRDKRLDVAQQLREGRALFVTRGCHNCHGGAEAAAGKPAYMPELDREAPQLAGIGQRLNRAWIMQWILQPASLRTDTTMPGLFPEPETEAAIDEAGDVSAYLLELAGALAERQETAAADDGTFVAKGQHLFKQLSCQGCHVLTKEEQAERGSAVSLRYVDLKFAPQALFRFLLRPRQHYAWSRMPDFRLSVEEASHLAAYLRHAADGELKQLRSSATPDARRGEIIFSMLGCANCHMGSADLMSEPVRFAPLSSEATAKGCLATDAIARGDAPQFAITDNQRSALAAFIAQDNDSLGRYVPAEEAARMVRQLRCGVCHTDDNGVMVREAHNNDTEQRIPDFIHAGERLHSAWMHQFIGDETDATPRPWLTVRMPAFPARAEVLSTGLATWHGIAPSEAGKFEVDPQLAEVGRQLAQKDAGFNCIDCHAVGPQRPATDPHARGIDLSLTAQRLRREYFDRVMRSPQLHAPGANLSPLARNGKSTANEEVLDGDAPRQFNALWHYMQQQRETENAEKSR